MTVTLICTFLLLCGLIGMGGTVTWVIRKGNNNKVTRYFVLCQISIIFWLVSQLLILFSSVKYQYQISYLIGNIGIGLFAPLWLMFSSEFCNIKLKHKKIILILAFITVTSVLFTSTNHFHNLYYLRFEVDDIEYGILFYIYQFLYYICIILGITMMCVKYTKEYTKISKQAVLLILSTAVPLAVNTLTLFHVIKTKIELTPLFFAFSSIMLLIALRRYGFLNINSIAMYDTIANIKSGVVIFDNEGNITFKNKSADCFFDFSEIKDYSSFTETINSLSLNTNLSEHSEICVDNRFLSIELSECYDKNNRQVASVVTINDVTKYHELAETEKKLSIEKERNRIAQEMHDSAGHTFTMISSLSKIASYELKKEHPEIKSVLENITDIDSYSRSGVTQLRCSINNLREDEFMTSITKSIQTIADSVRGVEVNYCTQGNEDERYSFCIRNIYDSVRETITNVMRYSEASRIDIIVKFLDSEIQVYILDNGKGCETIKENNGLKGIRERTQELNGKVTFTSVLGEGFTTIIKIPVSKEVNV